MPGPEFRLLETMKVSKGEIYLLARHLDRLSRSARHFGFVCDIESIRGRLVDAAVSQFEAQAARLLLSASGDFEIQFRPMPVANPVELRVSSVGFYSADPMLRHKITARDLYERARAGMPENMDALLRNERGEVTETTIANVAVRRGDVWVTPHLSCGLLRGTMRGQLLDDGEIREGIVRLKDLSPGELIRCFNAVRGVWDARLVP